MKIKIDKNHVCPFGFMCTSALLTARMQLRKQSFPFDWVFCDFDVVKDCLENDFSVFLDKTQYTDPVFKFTDRQCGHAKYHEDFFFHKHPRTDEDYQYYQRTVERFREFLKSDKSKLFITMITPFGTNHTKSILESFSQPDNSEAVKEIKKKCFEFSELLKQYTTNFNSLFIVNTSINNPTTSMEFEAKDNFQFLEAKTIQGSNGKEFLDGDFNKQLEDFISNVYEFI